MNEAMTFGKYGITIVADLEGTFDSVWREVTMYKLQSRNNRQPTPSHNKFLETL